MGLDDCRVGNVKMGCVLYKMSFCVYWVEIWVIKKCFIDCNCCNGRSRGRNEEFLL